ncbi:MAG TPA: thioredoxin family protein [Lacipirellula sp.]
MKVLATWASSCAVVWAALGFAGRANCEEAKPQAAAKLRSEPLEVAAAASAPAAMPITPPAAKAPLRLRHGVFKFSSYPAAWTSAQSSNRLILVFATSHNCPHCVRMINETFQAGQVRDYVNDSFETVYVNRSEQPELSAKLKVRWFPTTLIVGPNNQVLDVIEGYVDARTFSRRLRTTVAAHQATLKR